MEPPDDVTSAPPDHPPRWSETVFWKVAGLLLVALVGFGLGSVFLSARLALDASMELVENSIRLRMDALAEEIERRAPLLQYGLYNLPQPLVDDLSARFPDPIVLVDSSGQRIRTVPPDADTFGAYESVDAGEDLPLGIYSALGTGQVIVDMNSNQRSWGAAPIYDAAGLLVGGAVVYPMTNSRLRELSEAREAYMRALFLVITVAATGAIVLSGILTSRMVRPLRRITAQVERIGAGDYAATLPEGRRDEFGRLAGTINQMAHEISASVESLQSADRMRRELVANVGHDLRTPLAALRGYVEEALRYMSEGDADRARNCLHTVESQANYLATLVADLFELSILDSAEPRLRVEPVPLSELLTEAARSHEAEFKRRGITLERDFPGTLPTITGDGVRLLRLLDNLLANARNHTPQGGRVALAARRDGHYAEISVTDSGSGLSEADAQFVFDRYYRGDDARTRGRKGTGLGLAIARAIAVAHDGRLEARSDPGGGACFVLRLPEEGRSKLSPIAPV